MEKKCYITDEEREKCHKVVDAFEELYEDDEQNIIVLDAGRYGFVKLQYYDASKGFSDLAVFTDSGSLFDDLWTDWLNGQLFEMATGTGLIELDYEDIFKCMPEKTQKELMAKRPYFANRTNIEEIMNAHKPD